LLSTIIIYPSAVSRLAVVITEPAIIWPYIAIGISVWLTETIIIIYISIISSAIINTTIINPAIVITAAIIVPAETIIICAPVIIAALSAV
jgi:hypothetical protein